MRRLAQIASTMTMLAAATVVQAQGTLVKYKFHVPAALARQAKIKEDSAARIALARFPNGEIQSVELERESGKLQYSYEIKLPNAVGIEEVNVNAIDGSIIGVEHETPASEKKRRKPDLR